MRANTINVVQNCTDQCKRRPDSQDCEQTCAAAMSVLNKAFSFSPALAATYSRMEPQPPLEPEDDDVCIYNDPALGVGRGHPAL